MKTFNVDTATVQEVIDALKEARAASETTAALFLILLNNVETRRRDVWAKTGVATFDMWLNSHALVNVARYREFCAGLAIIGATKAAAIGEAATVTVGKFKAPTPEKIERLEERVEKFKGVHGVEPSAQTTQRWKHDIEPSEPKVVGQFNEMSKLRAENIELRAQIRERDQRIRKLKKLLAQARGSKVKRASKPSREARPSA